MTLTWQVRLTEIPDGAGETILQFSEVHFDKDGNPRGYCAACLVGDDEEEMRELAQRFAMAVALPVIKFSE